MNGIKWTAQIYHDVLDEWLDIGEEELWYNALEHAEALQADYPDLCLRIKRTITRQEITHFDLHDEVFEQMKEREFGCK